MRTPHQPSRLERAADEVLTLLRTYRFFESTWERLPGRDRAMLRDQLVQAIDQDSAGRAAREGKANDNRREAARGLAHERRLAKYNFDLTPQVLASWRARHAAGETVAGLARETGLPYMTVYEYVVNGRELGEGRRV